MSKPKTKKTKKKPEQTDLPAMIGEGVEEKKIPAIDKAARMFIDAKVTQREAGEALRGAGLELAKQMIAHDATTYKFAGEYMLRLDTKESVKISHITHKAPRTSSTAD